MSFAPALSPLSVDAVPVTRRDSITLEGFLLGSSVTLFVGARMLRTDGQVVDIQEQFSLSESTNLSIDPIQLADGWLLGLSINTGNVAVDAGALWLEAAVAFTSSPQGRQWRHLARGYVRGAQSLAWPQQSDDKIGDGPGAAHAESVSNPSAGADWTYSQAGGEIFEPACLVATLTADSNAASRQVELQVLEASGGIVFSKAYPFNTTADEAQKYSAVVGAMDTSDQFEAEVAPLPPIRLAEDWAIKMVTTNIQVGDQWSAILLAGRRWAGQG